MHTMDPAQEIDLPDRLTLSEGDLRGRGATPRGTPALSLSLSTQARDYLRQAKAANTQRAYRADWTHFTEWCSRHDRTPLPATEETLVLYFSNLASTHKPSTLSRRLSAISQAHKLAGLATPTSGAILRNLLAGIRRAKGTAPAVKSPVLSEDIRRIVETTPETLQGWRDRALLLVGFAGAFRRSELVSLDYADLDFQSAGLVVTLRRSKTDPEGQGRKVGIPPGSGVTCPLRALRKWIEAAAIASGPVFRPINCHGQIRSVRLSDKAVALVLKRCAQSAGLDPARYAGHSLRAGLATSAAMRGASERSIMNQTGHRSVQMVRRYIRDGELFRDNAAAQSGI